MYIPKRATQRKKKSKSPPSAKAKGTLTGTESHHYMQTDKDVSGGEFKTPNYSRGTKDMLNSSISQHDPRSTKTPPRRQKSKRAIKIKKHQKRKESPHLDS